MKAIVLSDLYFAFAPSRVSLKLAKVQSPSVHTWKFNTLNTRSNLRIGGPGEAPR